MSCELALTNSGVFNIIEGSYRRPGTSANSSGTRPQTRSETTSSQNTSNSVTSGSSTGEKEWVESARQALIILTNSIDSQHQGMALKVSREVNPAGLWNSLLQADPNKDPTNVDDLRENFFSFKMDPRKDTIRSTLVKLNSIRT
ncbi:hypothetical protein K3495_g2970 [Podosphaera aphanis]|nr:hypothetical protein K3495_g2970 [Podosphaera aphanis]